MMIRGYFQNPNGIIFLTEALETHKESAVESLKVSMKKQISIELESGIEGKEEGLFEKN
jgi:hypothetical protein